MYLGFALYIILLVDVAAGVNVPARLFAVILDLADFAILRDAVTSFGNPLAGPCFAVAIHILVLSFAFVGAVLDFIDRSSIIEDVQFSDRVFSKRRNRETGIIGITRRPC